MDKLMKKKSDMLKKKHLDKEEEKELKVLDENISHECEGREWKKLVKTLGSLESQDGHTNNTNIWKQMRKSFPKKNKQIPTGVKNIEGKLITTPNEKKSIILDHFIHRMRKKNRKR